MKVKAEYTMLKVPVLLHSESLTDPELDLRAPRRLKRSQQLAAAWGPRLTDFEKQHKKSRRPSLLRTV